MKRREFLKNTALASAAALPASSALAAAEASLQGDTPILRLFHKHQALTNDAEQYIIDHPEGDDEELEQLFYQQIGAIEAEMMALPSTCAADFAAKTIVDTAKGGCFSEWETGRLWHEARALVGAPLSTDPMGSHNETA